MKKTILILAALLGAILWTGCQKIEEPIEEEPEVVVPEEPVGSYTLTVEATKGADTKALSLDGSTLNAYWSTGEKVAVYLSGTYKGLLTATVNPSDNTKAQLTGTLESIEGVVANAVLTLLFPRSEWDYTGQNGAEPSADGDLATKYDYAEATVTVATVDNTNLTITTTGGADFANQQSMYRFGFKVGGAGDAIAIKGFTVSSVNNALVRSRTWSGSAWTDTPGSITVNIDGTKALPYASLRNTLVSPSNPNDNTIVDTYSFSVIGSDDALYLGEKGIPGKVMTVQGKFISAASITITKSNLAQTGTVSEVW